MRKLELRNKMEQSRSKVAEATSSIESMKSSRDTKRTDIERYQLVYEVRDGQPLPAYRLYHILSVCNLTLLLVTEIFVCTIPPVLNSVILAGSPSVCLEMYDYVP